ncbi:MAG: alpha/beta hydrolase [Sphingomonas sp.]|nr:alpha/beta hydrolase [Sphingomonas sp.]
MHHSVQIATPVLIGAALALLSGCAATDLTAVPSAPSLAAASAIPAGDARSVAIGGGRTMYLTCRGSGSPTVVLVSGLGERADNWDLTTDPSTAARAVFPEVGRLTRVCAYDRPGTETTTAVGREESRSTPVPQPTSGSAAAGDLAAMLAASGESGPYVLVGHSYGGDVVRLYAAAHPREVAGIVLVDALSEDLPTRLTPEQSADLERLNSPAMQGRPVGAEEFRFDVVFPELRAITSSPAVPVVVLTADRPVISAADIASGQLPPFVTQVFADALWSAQLAAQDALARRFPSADHVTVTHSGH